MQRRVSSTASLHFYDAAQKREEFGIQHAASSCCNHPDEVDAQLKQQMLRFMAADAAKVVEEVAAYSCRTTVRRDLFTLISPLYSMKPSFRNLFMNIFTRERVAPIMSANVS